MKRLLSIGIIILLFLGLSISSSTGFNLEKKSTTPLDGNTLYVGGSGPGNYTSIQDAIDNATDGDTVFVYNGTYSSTSTFIYINKSINLIGENKVNTIINDSWIQVNAYGVLISGFTLKNFSGISIRFSNNITIMDNIFNDGGIIFGSDFVYLMSYFNNNTISDNSFFNCGLVLWGYHNIVSNNTVNGKPLVYLESTKDKVIDVAGQVILVDCSNMTIQNINISSTFEGIQLYECENCYIKSNIISYSGLGVYLVECTNCYIISNILSFNGFSGLYLLNSTYNTISDNIIINNFIGLSIDFGENNNISSNSFNNDDIVNVLMQNSSDNLFLKNNFIFNISMRKLKGILTVNSDNKWKGNYWNESRRLPVIIWGIKIIKLFRHRIRPCFDIDWHPAQEPYSIEV